MSDMAKILNMKEAAVWMDEGTMGHCRLAYYTGCKDVLNKLQKGE